MPYVAIQTRAGLTADCTGLAIDPETGELHQTRPAIGGNIMATIKTPDARPQMATVRPKSKKPLTADESRSGDVVRVEMPEEFFVTKMTIDTFIANDLNEIPVEEADIVVSGGAGVGNLGNFALLEDLADVLGGTVGVSRVPVDQGWRPYIKQVGMSGKTIAPKLYIACGISGTVHHIVGMQTSETIVAINTDPEAKIFQVADLGVVGDLTKLLPKLTAKIKEEKERMAS
jgi:electron transfer flavoprotein alpha subunit